MTQDLPPRPDDQNDNTPLWLRAYRMRRAPGSAIMQPGMPRPVGRPRRKTVVQKTTLYLSPSDRDSLEELQKNISQMSGLSASLGDAAGIAARYLMDRIEAAGGSESFSSLGDLFNTILPFDDQK